MKMNRRKILTMLGISPALLAGSSAEAARAGTAAVASNAAGTGKITALNPKGMPPPIHLAPMAPRQGSLEGKTVYLVDTGFHGGDHYLQQVQGWFNRNMPSVKVEFRRKAGSYPEDDPKLWAEIKEKGHAAIMAIGH